MGSRSTKPANGLLDSDHQGTGGITATTVNNQIDTIVANNPNDIVLLMLGTNDALQDSNPAGSVPGELLSIMQELEQANPDVKILLGTLPATTRTEATFNLPAINSTLPGVVSQANNQGIDVTLVDFSNISTSDLYDGLHPDSNGVEQFADNWLAGLQAVTNEVNGTFDGTSTSISNIDDVIGGDNNDKLLGDNGANVLNGSGGNDWLDGRGGNDTLTGGNGNDVFAFNASENGANTITDYSGGEEIRLTGFGFSNDTQAGNAFSQSGSNVVFNRSGVSITILNANVNTVRNNVEVASPTQFSPEIDAPDGLDAPEDTFSFEAFTGMESLSRAEPVETQAPAGETLQPLAPVAPEAGSVDLFDLFEANDVDPDSGLYY